MNQDKKIFKILAASDLHGDSAQIRKLALQAAQEHVDLVVLCGDLTSPIITKDIFKPFLERNKNVVFVPGNHDGLALADFLAAYYNVRNLHATSTSYSTLGFFGLGGANIGLDAWREQEAYEILKQGFNQVKEQKKKIMITHVHPDGTIIDKITPGIGSTGIRRALDSFQPEYLLCGHVHEAEGVEDFIGKTKIIHVGRHGKILEIPLLS